MLPRYEQEERSKLFRALANSKAFRVTDPEVKAMVQKHIDAKKENERIEKVLDQKSW